MTYSSIKEIKKANAAINGHWFSDDTMRFFNCRILPTVYPEGYFISSEKNVDCNRFYTVRRCVNGFIETIGEFQGHTSAREAHSAIRKILDEEILRQLY